MKTVASEIAISKNREVKIISLGSYSLKHVEELARVEAFKYKARCAPELDSKEVINRRISKVAKMQQIGDFERIGPNKWQHKEALKFVREGGENTYAVYSDRDMAMKYYSID